MTPTKEELTAARDEYITAWEWTDDALLDIEDSRTT